jgi:hypothetical protein
MLEYFRRQPSKENMTREILAGEERKEPIPLTLFSSPYGLQIAIHDSPVDITMPGENDTYIPKGTVIGNMRFDPLLNNSLRHSSSHARLAEMRGFDDFFTFYDLPLQDLPSKDIEKPTYLVGASNEEMAAFAAAIGFPVVRKHEESNAFFVAGETEIVREGFGNYVASLKTGALEGLFARASKTNPEFWNSPRRGFEVGQGLLPTHEMIREATEREIENWFEWISFAGRRLFTGILLSRRK